MTKLIKGNLYNLTLDQSKFKNDYVCFKFNTLKKTIESFHETRFHDAKDLYIITPNQTIINALFIQKFKLESYTSTNIFYTKFGFIDIHDNMLNSFIIKKFE